MFNLFRYVPWKAAFFSVSLCCGFATPLTAQITEWPQFRGPGGQASHPEIDLPLEWSDTKGIAWRTELPGLGHSSPVHDGCTIWLTTAALDGTAMGVLEIDARTGRIEKQIPVFTPDDLEEIHQLNSYASPSPILNDQRLFVHYGTYGTACVDCQRGTILWKNTDLKVEHQGGPGSSPVLFEDLLILTLDGAQKQQVVALDVNDGSIRWSRHRSAPLRPNPIVRRAFSTPLLHKHAGQTQLISPAADQCHGYDPQDGRELWHVRYSGFSVVPRPVASENLTFFCTGFYQPELWAVDITGIGHVSQSSVRWKNRGGVPETPSPVLTEHEIVMVTNKGIVTALDLQTGERRWMLRVGGNFSSSPLYAGGLLFFCSEEGVTKIVDPHLPKPRIIFANRLNDRIMASPAIIDHDLLIRTDKSLYRITSVPGEN